MKKTVLSFALFSATLFLSSRAAEPPAAPAAPARDDYQARLLQRYDANHDGKLDEAELAAAHETMLKDGPGGKGPRAAKVRARLLKRFDANGDGKLDESERAAVRNFFAQFDQNGDGQLDENERAAMREQFRAKAGQPKN